jgi:THO complex subunit 2
MLLPYQIRYALYNSSRKLGLEKAALRSMSRPPKPLLQIESEVNTSISTKFIFKRMSKENVKDMGRQLARVAHNNPMVVFTLMLNQIESYDNLIEMMVDSFKYMGLLSLDVMGYCLLVSLGGEGEVRDKVKGKSEVVIKSDFMIINTDQMNLPTSNRFRSQRMASTQHNGFLR